MLAFRFEPDDVEVLRAAVGAGYELVVADDMDQRAIDAAVGPGVVGLIGQQRPSDQGRAPDLRWHQVLSAGVDPLVRQEYPRVEERRVAELG